MDFRMKNELREEYEIKIPSNVLDPDFEEETFNLSKGAKWWVQKLVDRFGIRLQIRQIKPFEDDEFQAAGLYNFEVTRVTKNVAIAEARLRNSFKRPDDLEGTMFESN